ncbi:hypothetical protein UFOVP447_85 [uncultured Caudovirales phage]|uniref:Baseplate wedge subunit n=1 Tax=uncultured Caudovirales phage TaxID=2100421 RepID=A0A6J5M8Y3_9CAUD|nr:hypothetical protein UFOVP447_85 [uncultured Caudovirales phage]
MSINQKITSTLNVQAAESFVQSVLENAAYYVFAAKHTPFGAGQGGGSDEIPPVPQDTVVSSIQVYNDMVFGKKVKDDSIINMIRRYEWNENSVYDMYRDNDTDLASKQFYVVIDDSIELNVYKCLFNNNGARSTQKPFGKDNTPIEFPQDGYIWKYMFTVDQFNIRKFATSEYIPVTPNQEVANNAVAGSIEIITVDNSGAGYNNYTVGQFPDTASIAVGSNLRFGLDASASSISTFYKDCLIRMTSGVATNEYRLITDYTITNGQKVITIDRAFNNRPNAGDEYEIFPNVFVYDVSGTSTANCVARAIVNSAIGNAISRVEVLSTGAGYRLATAKIKTANIVSVTSNAVVTPVISPPGGHGSNINNELFGRFVGISSSFIGNNEPLSANNDYRTVGLLKNPQFANVNIILDAGSITGSFITNEVVYRYKPVRLYGNVSISANSLVTGTDTAFIDTFRTNDRVIITNGITNIFANVQVITSDTLLTIDKEPTFTGSNCAIYLVEAVKFGKVTDYNSINISLTDVDPVGLEVSSYLLGEVSSCSARVSNTQPYVTVNGRNADEFNAFNQLTTFVGSFTSAVEFIEDEFLIQDTDDIDTSPTARVHSYRDNPGSANDYLYVTNVSNVFDLNGVTVIRGLTSNAYFDARYKYNGEIVPDSGEILYLENLKPITRDFKQTETVKLILEF